MYGEGMIALHDQVLLVPGLYNSGPGHWQALWEKEYGFARVEQQDWDTPRCEDWVRTLNDTIEAQSAPVILVAHSLGCITVAVWAATHPAVTAQIKGALLVAPSDTERPDFPPGAKGFAPVPQTRLPFKSTLVASSNDHYTSLSRSKEFASAWASTLVIEENAGHLSGVDGFGPWPRGLQLLQSQRS